MSQVESVERTINDILVVKITNERATGKQLQGHHLVSHLFKITAWQCVGGAESLSFIV